MPLSSTERANIRMYLGWSARFHQTDTRLEQAMNAVDNLDDELTQLRAHMTEIQAIETRISSMRADSFRAREVGDIVLDAATEYALNCETGNRRCAAMAAILGVEVRRQYFSSAGPEGFAGPWGMSDGGNYFPQG